MQVAIGLDDAGRAAFSRWLACAVRVVPGDELTAGEAIRAVIRVMLRYAGISGQAASRLRHERAAAGGNEQPGSGRPSTRASRHRVEPARDGNRTQRRKRLAWCSRQRGGGRCEAPLPPSGSDTVTRAPGAGQGPAPHPAPSPWQREARRHQRTGHHPAAGHHRPRSGRPAAGRRRAARRTLLTSPEDHAPVVTKDRSLAHAVHMPDGSGHCLLRDHHGPRQRQVRLSRGHRRRQDAAGAIRRARWPEPATVTWPPAPAPDRRPAVLQRALAGAAGLIATVLAGVAVTSARRLRRRRPHRLLAASLLRRQPASAGRELPRSGRTP